MSAGEAAPGWVHALARVCLLAYPASFRREHSRAYREAVTHRWVRERRHASRLEASMRTAGMLLADTVRAAVSAHVAVHRASRSTDRRRAHRAMSWFARAMAGTAMDGRVAIRSLAKRPAFTALVVLTLGLAVGANAAIFGVLDRIVLRPLPYRNGDRMVYIADHHPQLGWNIAPSSEAVSRWRISARTLEWIETFVPEDAVWTGERAAELLPVTAVSAGLPAALGVQALVGRVPTAEDLEPSDPPVVMLAEGFWKRHFGGDTGVVGRTVTLNDTMFTIAGIWPTAARLEHGRVPDIVRIVPRDVILDTADGFALVLALVRHGATVSDVETELRALGGRPEDSREGFIPVVNAPYWLAGESYVQGVWLVFGGVVILMIVALANTANLLLGRTGSRAGELGIRAAVGGSAAALARLFLVESLALTLLGVATALVVARTVGAALVSLVLERLPGLQGAPTGARALGYGAMLAAGAALLCVLVPAAQLRSLDVRRLLGRAEAGRSGGGRSGWTRQLLVAVQVGLAVVLVTGSALTLRSFQKLMAVDVGMDVDRLAEFNIQLPASHYATPEARSAFWDRVLEAIESMPGVEGVTSSTAPLMGYSMHAGAAHLEGELSPAQKGTFSYGNGVPPGFFPVTGLRLIEGRDFDRSDVEDVIIVNQAFARRTSDSVVGRDLVYGDSFYRIIGVAADVMNGGQRANPDRLQFYTPAFELRDSWARFIVRTSGDPATLLATIRARIAQLDPDLPLRDVTTGTQVLRDDTARQRFVAQLLAVFGSLTLVLAISGVYGVVALDVSRRTREVGIRVALGAGGRRVARDVVAAGLRPVVFGIATGALASVWAARYVEGILYRISAVDPLSIALGIGLLLVAATTACAVPARRASRVDPIQALRSE
ncbi:MAG: ADOP family duplicated permease [Longimicrobiales bacterium]